MWLICWTILVIVVAAILIRKGHSPGLTILAAIVCIPLGLLFLFSQLAAIVLWGLLGIAGGSILAKKGYSPILGVAIGLILGPLGLLIALGAPRTVGGHRMKELDSQIEHELQAARETRECPKCGRENAGTSRFCPRCNYRFES